MQTSYEEDLLIVFALNQLQENLNEFDSAIATHAQWLAIGIAEQYGLEMDDVTDELNRRVGLE
ncbi:hypothetical protein [Natrononativus amylolyticus]|uniref:hypothetical protein n=1 Tax=Natrononativus amylolyticus TaxID=2963434 RepID=UPI0020CF02AB|nr:hypothetical protein [Natrononativus amylolyticus]